MTNDPIQRWTTANVEQTRRLDYYEAALNLAVLPVSVSSADPRTFRFEMSYANFGDLGVCKQSGSPHSSMRGRSELARSDAHNFTLVMLPQTSWTIDHRGSSQMSPCDVLILDSQHPLKFKVCSPFTAITVGLSEAWLRQWIPNPNVLATRPIPGTSLWGRALSAYLGELSPDLAAAPPLPLNVIADQVGSLLSLTANGLKGETVANTLAVRSLYEQIQDCLAQRCTEWELTALDVATSISISVRTLHRTLAATDQTFGGALIAARARVAVRMLTSPGFNQVTTAEIGRRAGFPSASHFARVIRDRTGTTPLQLRRNNQSYPDRLGNLDSSESL